MEKIEKMEVEGLPPLFRSEDWFVLLGEVQEEMLNKTLSNLKLAFGNEEQVKAIQQFAIAIMLSLELTMMMGDARTTMAAAKDIGVLKEATKKLSEVAEQLVNRTRQ